MTKDPDAGGVGASQHFHQSDGPENTATPDDAQAQTRRALSAIEAALQLAPLPDPAVASQVLCARLGAPERRWLAEAAIGALPVDAAELLCETLLAAFEGQRLGPLEAEAARMVRQWTEFCRRNAPRPPASVHQLRAAPVAVAELVTDARRQLADAWARASTRDRRDLISRVTGARA